MHKGGFRLGLNSVVRHSRDVRGRIDHKLHFSRLARNVLGVPGPGDSNAIVRPMWVDHCDALKQRFGEYRPAHNECDLLLRKVVSGVQLLAEGAVSDVQPGHGSEAIAAESMAVASDLADLHGAATETDFIFSLLRLAENPSYVMSFIKLTETLGIQLLVWFSCKVCSFLFGTLREIVAYTSSSRFLQDSHLFDPIEFMI